jgi:hypothetical protein
VPGQPLREHPPHHRRRRRVGLEPVRPAAPRGVGLVRMRPGIGQPVPVRRPTAQVPSLLAGLGGHRGADPDPGPGDLPLGRQPERQHGLLVVLGVPVDPAADFGHPQLDPVVLEQRSHRGVLAGVERPLVLPDHDRIPAAVRIGQLRDQRGGLRAPRPRQGTALPRLEELRHDDPDPGNQHQGLLQLPRPRRHRILPVLGRDPPVKREPQTAPAPPGGLPGQALRPVSQHIAAPGRAGRTRHHHGNPHSLLCRPGASSPATQDAAATARPAEREHRKPAETRRPAQPARPDIPARRRPARARSAAAGLCSTAGWPAFPARPPRARLAGSPALSTAQARAAYLRDAPGHEPAAAPQTGLQERAE